MDARRGGGDYAWWTRTVRYTVAALVAVALVLAAGWALLGDEGRLGLGLAAGVVLTVQLLSFAVLATRRIGSPGLLLVWGSSTLVRFGVIGISAFVLAGIEGVDLAVALLAMAGLFFVLLLLEPWALRERDRKPKQP
jgi:hypothetical protein